MQTQFFLYTVLFVAVLGIGGFFGFHFLFSKVNQSQSPPFSMEEKKDMASTTPLKSDNVISYPQGEMKNAVRIGNDETLKNLQMIAAPFLDKPEVKEALQKALEYEKNIVKNPNQYDAYLAAGFWWKSLGDYTLNAEFYDHALFIFDAAIQKFNGKTKVAFLNAADISGIRGNFAKEEEYLKRGMGEYRGEALFYLKLADLWRYKIGKTKSEYLGILEEGLKYVFDEGREELQAEIKSIQ